MAKLRAMRGRGCVLRRACRRCVLVQPAMDTWACVPVRGSVPARQLRLCLTRRRASVLLSGGRRRVGVSAESASAEDEVRDPTTWTVLQHDGPNHFGLWYNMLPAHQMALITSGCVPFQVEVAETVIPKDEDQMDR